MGRSKLENGKTERICGLAVDKPAKRRVEKYAESQRIKQPEAVRRLIDIGLAAVERRAKSRESAEQ